MHLNLPKNNLYLYLLSIVAVQIGDIVRWQLNFQMFGNMFRILGGAMVAISIYRQLMMRQQPRLPFLMNFLLIWNTLNIIITLFTSGLSLTRMFGEPTYFFVYLLPYLLLYDIRQIPLRQIFTCCFVFVVLAAILIGLNANYFAMAGNVRQIAYMMAKVDGLAYFAQLPVLWSIPAAILFMNYELISRKKLVFSLVCFVLAIGFSMTFGRRSTSAYGGVFLLAAAWIYINNSGFSPLKKTFLLLFFTLIGFGVIAFVGNNFAFLMQRGLEDSRSAVDKAFWVDMNVYDLIFGRGLNGTYYDPMNVFDVIKNRRPGHETGYMNMILHSGSLFLIPYWLICFKSAFIGYFRSNNTLTKSFAIYIFLNAVLLLKGSYPSFALRFYLIWIGILICNSFYFREMDDDEIQEIYYQ